MKDYGHYQLFRKMSLWQEKVVKKKMDEGWEIFKMFDNTVTLRFPRNSETSIQVRRYP
jgi:hypothetical protein